MERHDDGAVVGQALSGFVRVCRVTLEAHAELFRRRHTRQIRDGVIVDNQVDMIIKPVGMVGPTDGVPSKGPLKQLKTMWRSVVQIQPEIVNWLLCVTQRIHVSVEVTQNDGRDTLRCLLLDPALKDRQLCSERPAFETGREGHAQADPTIRAERAINQWQQRSGERSKQRGWQDDRTRAHIEGEMRKVANTIKRDPQVASIVRDRAQELGIHHIGQGQNIGHAMEKQLGRGIER